LKCLNKEPGQRYATALELAEDLHRFATGQPILARPVGPWEKAWLLCRRNRLSAALAGATVGALLLSTAAMILLALRASSSARKAGHNADRAEMEAEYAQAQQLRADRAAAAEEAVRRQAQQALYCADLNLAGQASETPGGSSRVHELLE